jgi:hypothetical protein
MGGGAGGRWVEAEGVDVEAPDELGGASEKDTSGSGGGSGARGGSSSGAGEAVDLGDLARKIKDKVD